MQVQFLQTVLQGLFSLSYPPLMIIYRFYSFLYDFCSWSSI